MLDLLPVFVDATKTLQREMTDWFKSYPRGQLWTVVSDYCIGDENKQSDVFSFVVIANHDTAENIGEYLAGAAPKDIKNTKQVPLGLVQYLTCPHPITFSISFVLDRESALLRDYLRVEDMVNFIPDIRSFIESLQQNSPVDSSYFDQVLKRFDAFEKDFERKQFNAKLARQIHLASAFVATTFYIVNQATGAGYLRWISDRDALVERYDTLVYDLAYLYFILLSSTSQDLISEMNGKVFLKIPNIRFEIPEKTGKHRFDELVRLPDYLAGTLADLDITDMSFTRDKFAVVMTNVFVDSFNNWIVRVFSDGEKIIARSIKYQTN